MKIVNERTILGVDTKLVFTKAERATLLRAAQIADDARTLCRGVIPEHEWELSPQDMDLAHVEHAAREIADGVLIAETFDPMGLGVIL